MATIKNGILGKFNGSIGNITGYNLAGQMVVREKAINVSNPSTPSPKLNIPSFG